MRLRLTDILSFAFLALMLGSLATPFSAGHLRSHVTRPLPPQAEVLTARTTAAEDIAAKRPPTIVAAPVSAFVLAYAVMITDEASKRQIPSRILRL